MMKKLILACAMLSIPAITLAQPMDVNCQLNTPCEMKILPQFNKIVHTYNIMANKNYLCSVLSGDGKSFVLHNIHHSPGVQLHHSATLETPFEIIGPSKGEGMVTYTVHNNSFWESYSLRYECKTQG